VVVVVVVLLSLVLFVVTRWERTTATPKHGRGLVGGSFVQTNFPLEPIDCLSPLDILLQ